MEIFSIDGGWNVEALGDVAEMLGDSMEGWSVEGISDDFSEEGLDELDEEQATASSSGRAAQPVRFGGRALGKAEAQVLASLPRHMIRRLEAEQQEAEEGERGPVCVLACGASTHHCSSPRSSCALATPGRPVCAERERLRPAARKKVAARFKTHQQLRIISGSAAGKRLRSPQGDQVRLHAWP